MNGIDRIVIAGAGHAGGSVCRALRAEGYEGSLTLIGEENYPPHERPPLSKSVLTGAEEPESTFFLTAETLTELSVDFRFGDSVDSIDRHARTVTCRSGDRLAYDRLVLATGSTVRRLSSPGSDHPAIHYLRTIDDSLALRTALQQARRLVVVGGGWIGLEVAAAARKMDVNVTILEAADRLCARAVPAFVSDHLAKLHERNGVDLRLNAALEGFEPQEGDRVTARLASGKTLPADVVVVGIGVLPNDGLARDAGLPVENGILTDACGRTDDPAVFACGDVTNQDNSVLGRRVRLESWANAQNQSAATAQAVLGLEAAYDDVPWFWSDQYDMNLQILGVPPQWGDPIVRGDGDAYSAFFLKDGKIEAVIAINTARDLMIARRLIQAGATVDADRLTDTGTKLQDILRQARQSGA